MRYERLKGCFQTLRGRLTLWNTAVVVILLAVSLLAVRQGLQRAQTQMVDEFVQEELYAAVRDFDRLRADPVRLRERFDRQATGHPRRRLFIQLMDEYGNLDWASEQSPDPATLPPQDLPFSEPRTVQEHRILCRQVTRADGQTAILRVGCSLGRSYLEMQRYNEILLGVGLVLLLATPVGGFLLAGRATRPLARIIQTTARLQPDHLDERLPLRGTRDELDDLSRTINQFLDRLASYLRQSRDFTANAAHELRSPLTALQSSLEIALNADRTIEQYKELLAVLLEECGQMRVLVNQLLLLAEGDAGRLRLLEEPVRLDRMVSSSLEMFNVVAEAHEVSLILRRLDPVELRGDGSRLWQVVNNLIDNALKFTPSGGSVTVALTRESEPSRCQLEVTDTGIGIAPHDLPHVFERFYQGDKARERDTHSRGLGLGLSICQAIVTAHGGTIELASTHGKGTTLTVYLPI